MNVVLKTLGAEGLQRFHTLEPDAVSAVTERFYSTLGSVYAQFGPRGRDACREDLAFYLEFLKPVLELGLLAPMVDYLCWLASVLDARTIPAEHLALSLDWLAEFFAARMEASDGRARVRSFTMDGEAVVVGVDVSPSSMCCTAGTRPAVPSDTRSMSSTARISGPCPQCPQGKAGAAVGAQAGRDGLQRAYGRGRRHRVPACLFRHARKLGFEGIVSKRLTAPSRSGPSRDWLKVKNQDSPAMRRARR
jgi:hypothetical protein